MVEVLIVGVLAVIIFVAGLLVGRKWSTVIEKKLRAELAKLETLGM